MLVVEGELRSLNPATLEVVGSVPATDPVELGAVVARAREAQTRWAETSLDARRRLVLDTARVLLDRMDEIAALVTAETGKPLVESYTAELLVSVENALWVAANAPRVLLVEKAPFAQLYLKHKRGYLVYEPLGAVAVISPWNFPFSIPFTQTAAAVAAGNAVVVKPSELTPLSGAWVARHFADAGAPREQLVPVTLELGGKDAMLVLDDADLDRAVEGALWGSFFNAGQVCSG